jgi:hypothetical protein
MSKMKYLWTAALLALCVCLASGAALAQDWAVDSQDLPSALLWDATYDASVGAQNTSGGSWGSTYDLRSMDGITTSAIPVDRWGLLYTPEGGISGTVVDDAVYVFDFTVTAPPITTMDTLACQWMVANNAVLIDDDVAATSDVTISRFSDIQPGEAGNWARFEIEEIAGRVPAIASGFAPGEFGPTVSVDRAMMAVFVSRAAKLTLTAPATASFPDVPTDYWAYSEIETLADAGIVLGYLDGNYDPTGILSRDQMAVFVVRATGWAAPDPTADLFLDVPVGFWADNEIGACVDHAVVAGYLDGNYHGDWTLSRDQLAVFMYRAFIQPTGTQNAVVLGGPATTDVDPDTAGYDGWSSQDVDPGYAYVVFDGLELGPDLDGDADTNWTVTFDFRDDATPTTVGTTVDVDTAASSLPGTEQYFVVSTPVPGLASGDYVLVVLVEDETGAMVEIARTVAFTVS